MSKGKGATAGPFQVRKPAHLGTYVDVNNPDVVRKAAKGKTKVVVERIESSSDDEDDSDSNPFGSGGEVARASGRTLVCDESPPVTPGPWTVKKLCLDTWLLAVWMARGSRWGAVVILINFMFFAFIILFVLGFVAKSAYLLATFDWTEAGP